MKKTFYLAAAAALVMASTTAHAGNGISFEIDGQKIRIESPRNCNSLSCLSVTNNGAAIDLKNLSLKGKKSDDDDDVASNAPPAHTSPAPAAQVPPAPPPVASTIPPAPPAPPAPAVANNVPPAPPAPPTDSSQEERVTSLPAINQPSRATNTTPASPAPVANNAPPAQPQQASAVPPAAAPTTPLGVWQTEDNKGNVRIEQCGANLCGYADKTNERILINMKPSGSKWEGRIHDPDSGSNYDSTIAMKGPNTLKVQGCALGGLFCGGQIWKRIS